MDMERDIPTTEIEKPQPAPAQPEAPPSIDPPPAEINNPPTATIPPDNPITTESTPTTTAADPPPAPRKPKRIRKKKPKDALAPKLPLSGYNFFMREIRPQVLERNPDANIQEITKKVALEWGVLTEELKRPYLQRADEEKRRYTREMGEYKQFKVDQEKANPTVETSTTDKDNSPPSKKSKSGMKEEETPLPMLNGKTNGSTGTTAGQSFAELLRKRTGDYEIPIFTDDFLEHNKALDSELRTLRKSQTDYEQQNSILEKHVENMQNGVTKLTGQTDALKEENRVLNNYLNDLRLRLVESFGDLAIPTEPNGATLENIDSYMGHLQKMVTSNSHGPASLNKAKDIVRKTDLNIVIQPPLLQ